MCGEVDMGIQMKSKRRGGTVLIAIGLLLIAAALLITGKNLIDERKAGEAANHVLTILKEEIPAADASENPRLEQSEPPDYILNPDMEMPVVEIEGNNYIGILDIPSLELSLPVISEWNYPSLRLSPCRYSGSAYAGNFTIAGHNYSTHFGSLKNLQAGDLIRFTDVKGRSFLYQVQTIETLEPTAIEDMLSDEWDLTLFTCTSGGQARVTVRCLKAD